MATALRTLWRFSRPHTVIGTSLSIWAIFTLACLGQPWQWGNLLWPVVAWGACLLGNVYIVGLNQLTDVAIDRINKPQLPLPQGDLSINQARWIVGSCGVGALAIAGGMGPWLGGTVGMSLGIGTAYSLPPLRLKRFALLAALCILVVRGILVNLGLYGFFQTVLGQEVTFNAPIWGLTGFILIFSIAIAIFKDVPDMDGDRQFQIQTLTIQIGKEKVFHVTRWLLTGGYGALILWALAGEFPLNRPVFILVHLGLVALLWGRSGGVGLEDKIAIASFYQFIWKLFFLEYILYPLILTLPPA